MENTLFEASGSPPYHSKYNAVERCWGILEQHWNRDILDCLETVKRFAQSMAWKGKFPDIDKLYQAWS
ncbi:MAG: hypothetical protein HXX08_08200 [Chloroflexi bacterium]|uniref:Transposase n=1 Tax=Candidatus Chlorohelix allophototropha TaxID=3003348 RepID=A0A8T7LUZ7_9CHLR|nr:hypothetical protein [Chloroflexota bacterium]WJW67709.1 hypothetical protein OZ401_000984 [Chloroflexota bacterium L227-S17]